MEHKMENKIMLDIITNIIDSRILEILKTIHSNYPDKFSSSLIEKEFDYIKKHIILKHLNGTENRKPKPKPKIIVKPIIHIKINHNHRKKKKINIKLNKLSIKQSIVKEPVIQEPVLQEPVVKEVVLQEPVLQEPVLQEPVVKQSRIHKKCCARTWSDHIFKKNGKVSIKLNDIDDKFKVTDYNDINIKEFNANYIIGKQCNKSVDIKTKYCKLHTRHLVHGDYFTVPSKELCYHFMKDGKYL